MKKKNILLYIGVSMLLLLVACSGQSTEDKIHEHLEEAVNLEQDFTDQQSVITELEEKEQDIYDDIIELSMDEFDTIKELATEAIEVIQELGEKVDLEKESLNASKEEFVKIKDLIDELEDEAVKEKTQELYDVMIQRFDAYESLNEAYVNSLNTRKDLYELVQKEDATQEELSEKVTLINSDYEKVIEENEVFNENTESFNNLKKEFYDVAGIDATNTQD